MLQRHSKMATAGCVDATIFPSFKEEGDDVEDYEASGVTDQDAEEKPVLVQVKQEYEEPCDMEEKHWDLLSSASEDASAARVKTEENPDEDAAIPNPAACDKTLVCICCGDVFRTYSNLKNHLKTHAKEKRFSYMKSLIDFTQESFPPDSFVCSVCGKELMSQQNLKKHLRLHDKNRVNHHACSTCGKRFSQKVTLLKHTQTHEVKAFICSQCGETFPRRHALTKHMESHAGAEPGPEHPE